MTGRTPFVGVTDQWGSGSVLAIAAVAMSVLAFSCSKRDIFKSMEGGKLFVRIVQVDKNGTEQVSKVVRAVEE
ncbi:hypothetical protein [Niabella aurantiaca]|uniref:hypothetical protein n=1 Tax=Niabella aurantiaca TaxID=379900 RepID=UPI00036B2D4C|nr:hypothetical protein [Niabella aurantiaca]